MIKRAAIAILVLTLVFTFLGCSKGNTSSTAPSGINIQILTARSSQAADQVRLVQYDTTMNAQIKGQAEGEDISASISSQASQALDITNRKSYIVVETTMEMADVEGQVPDTVKTETYTIGNTAYIRVEMLDESQWYKQQVSATNWQDQQDLWQLGGLLKKSTSLKIVGEEQVNGINCYVIDIIIDAATAWKAITQQPAMSDVFDSEAELQDMVRSMSVKEWIAKDTYLPVKAHVEMEIVMDSGSQTPSADLSMSMTMQLETYFRDYNQPVTIELPPEAADAIEIPATPTETATSTPAG